jgi:hypothetical protein
MDNKTLLNELGKHHIDSISGRYLNEQTLLDTLKKIVPVKNRFLRKYSVENRPLHELKFGHGPYKIMIWSQMHGNESTTTKALLDFVSVILSSKAEWVNQVLNQFSFHIIPMLNPDGAELYQRKNANNVDLNRDALECSQPESKLLLQAFEEFNPDLCLNLHDQRTIFSAGDKPNPATVSFLAPAFDEGRTINRTRKIAMKLIVEASQELSKFIPNQIGRYDDKFNLNCVGDYFTHEGVPTVLFEAGHFPGDYKREKTREYIFLALVCVILKSNQALNIKNFNISDYLRVPENQKLFYDIIIRQVRYKSQIMDFTIRFEEYLEAGKIKFYPQVTESQDSDLLYAHRKISGQQRILKFETGVKNPEIRYIKALWLGKEKLSLSLTNH